jgi:hypothetical protein
VVSVWVSEEAVALPLSLEGDGADVIGTMWEGPGSFGAGVKLGVGEAEREPGIGVPRTNGDVSMPWANGLGPGVFSKISGAGVAWGVEGGRAFQAQSRFLMLPACSVLFVSECNT